MGGFVWWFDECGFGGLLMADSRWVLFGCLSVWIVMMVGYGLWYF